MRSWGLMEPKDLDIFCCKKEEKEDIDQCIVKFLFTQLPKQSKINTLVPIDYQCMRKDNFSTTCT